MPLKRIFTTCVFLSPGTTTGKALPIFIVILALLITATGYLLEEIFRRGVGHERDMDDARHGRGIWRSAAWAAVVEHLVAEILNVPSFDLHVQRPRREEFRRAFGIVRDDPAPRPLARNVSSAIESRASDSYRLPVHLYGLGVSLGVLLALANVGQWCRHEGRWRARHLADVGQRGDSNAVASLCNGSFGWIYRNRLHS